MISSLYAGTTKEIDKKWSSNKKCEACHMKISSYWETSRHSNSHFSKNDLYKKSLEYIILKSPKLIMDEVKIDCAKCHNPRITQKYVTSDDKMLLALGITKQQEKYTKALNTEYMKNGINCIVCHNIDKIHLDKTVGSQGLNSVKFGPQGTMYGPLDDANSPYHKTEQRPHFTDDNPTLCFSCHYSTKNHNGLEVYATGKEYDEFKNKESEEGCKKCHMSEKKEGYASNFPIYGKQPRKRMVRDHKFASVDNSDIFNKNVEIKSKKEDDKYTITLINRAPHSVPTGYGLREIILQASFLDKSGKVLSTNSNILGTSWKDKRGELTIPHLATSIKSDTRLKGKSEETFYYDIPKGAKSISYKLSYRLIGSDIAKKIGVADKFFLREYIMSKKKIDL